MSDPKILTIDLETSPLGVDTWGLWNQNIGISQLHVPTRMICFAAKWHGQKRVLFFSEEADGREAMLSAAYDLLTEADVVVHFNGERFDVPHLNREFVTAGLTPPAPFQQVDLMRVVKKNFAFPSNKLAYVTHVLGLSGKLTHEGHTLWVRCLRDHDPAAWRVMRRYNIQDVRTTEELYDRLLPWIQPHPTVGLYTGESLPSCPNCGSTELQKRGFSFTTVSKFQRFRCDGCGKWCRGKTAVARVDVRGVA